MKIGIWCVNACVKVHYSGGGAVAVMWMRRFVVDLFLYEMAHHSYSNLMFS